MTLAVIAAFREARLAAPPLASPLVTEKIHLKKRKTKRPVKTDSPSAAHGTECDCIEIDGWRVRKFWPGDPLLLAWHGRTVRFDEVV